MIRVAIHYQRACGWYGNFNKSEMALFSECTDRYAQKLLDTADIVRDAIYRQQTFPWGVLRTGYSSLGFSRADCRHSAVSTAVRPLGTEVSFSARTLIGLCWGFECY